jgi:hypothetical protein
MPPKSEERAGLPKVRWGVIQLVVDQLASGGAYSASNALQGLGEHDKVLGECIWESSEILAEKKFSTKSSFILGALIVYMSLDMMESMESKKKGKK